MAPPGPIGAFIALILFLSPFALLVWFGIRSLRILRSQFPRRTQLRRLLIQTIPFAVSWSILGLIANWAHANLTAYTRSLLLGKSLAHADTDDNPWLLLLNIVGIVPEFPMYGAYTISLLLSWGNSTAGVIYVIATVLSAVLALLTINLVAWLLLHKVAQQAANI